MLPNEGLAIFSLLSTPFVWPLLYRPHKALLRPSFWCFFIFFSVKNIGFWINSGPYLYDGLFRASASHSLDLRCRCILHLIEKLLVARTCLQLWSVMWILIYTYCIYLYLTVTLLTKVGHWRPNHREVHLTGLAVLGGASLGEGVDSNEISKKREEMNVWWVWEKKWEK